MSSATPSPARSMEQTATWAVAAVCFVMVAISIFLEYILHVIGKWLQKKHKLALYEALEKVKAELMLLGFISLLLTIAKGPISSICVPISVGDTWLPCSNEEKYEKAKKTDGYTDKCLDKPGNRVALMSTYAINQLHYFIFFLAVFHVLYSLLTMTFASAKMRRWKMWEKETRTAEYQYSHDPERFRFARNTTFGRRHLSFWSRSTILLWIVCFFRQFFRSVLKVDYLTLRHGFIMAHLAPQSASHFDFQKYIKRSFEEDFKVVVGISPVIWLSAILFLLTNTNGWYTSLWLPFIPLVILLLVGTKLQVNITKMGLRIHEKGDVVRGVPMVQPTDELFWFNRPKFLLFLIHFVLFQNAFQLAFFAWTTYEFGLKSCFHEKVEDVAIRIAMGVVIEFLCSYVTLPLYALVTQMGSTMKPTIFNERVATALKKWHHQARKHTKQSAHGNSASVTPLSSMPTTPTRGMSPVHLLRHHRGEPDSANPYHWESEGSPSPSVSPNRRFHYALEDRKREAEEMGLTLPKKEEMVLTEIQISSPPHELLTRRETDVGDDSRGHHQINIELGDSKDDFSFDKRPRV